MDKLIIVRTGTHNPKDRQLTHEGERQIKNLATAINLVIAEGNGIILYSPVLRAKQSAEILDIDLEIETLKLDVLHSEQNHQTNLAAVLTAVNDFRPKYDVVILVTHLEYAEEFPPYFAKKVLGETIPKTTLKKGTMRTIDCSCLSE